MDFLISFLIVASFIFITFFQELDVVSKEEPIRLDKEDLDAVSWDDNKQHTEQNI